MASIVGGIFYRPQHTKELRDIYGELIDLPKLSSYVHEPVKVSSQPSGYQQQYQITTPQSENKEVAVEQTQDTTVSPTWVIPTYGELSNKDILTGEEGFKQLEKLYESALQNRGIDAKYAKWLAAQDALESGWGKSQGAKRNNYGNITTGSSWTGDSFIGDDHDAQNRPITQRFRAYSSVEDYIEDKLDLLQSNRYKSAFIGNVDNFIDRVFNSGYAVDPQYVQKVRSVYNNLT